MKIHILTYTKRGKETGSQWVQLEMLRASAEKLGHEVEFVYADDCQLRFFRKPQVYVQNKKPNINILLIKAGFAGADADSQVSLIKQFELAGINVVNKHYAVRCSKNKVKNIQVLQKHGVPTPKTMVIRSSEYLEDVIKEIGKFPLILKTNTGSLGVGVMIVESKRALSSLMDMLQGQQFVSVVVQEYIKESSGKDIRAFVVGNKVIASMERIARKRGEFRSNFSLGGKVRPIELTDTEKKLAIKATKACELDMAGVDIIRTKSGPKVLEVNANPGIEGITEATGIDVAGEIIKYCVRKAKKLQLEKNGKKPSKEAIKKRKKQEKLSEQK